MFNPDIICEEFNRINSMAVEAKGDNNEVDKEPKEDPKKKPDTLARGKHYTVFSFQTWNGKQKLINFVVA